MMMTETPPIEHAPIRRLKRLEYEQLAKLGIFDRERVELVFGQVVTMSPIDPAHVESVTTAHELLVHKLAGRARVRCQQPLAATDDSEPQPDIYVTAPGHSWDELPSRALLVVEVSRSSLKYDRGEKAFLYSISEVDEYWIVDHVHELIEVRRDRQAGVWLSIETFRRGDRIRMLAFPDVEIAVSEILPPQE
jgi:Uma2 family endonuclease